MWDNLRKYFQLGLILEKWTKSLYYLNFELWIEKLEGHWFFFEDGTKLKIRSEIALTRY